MKVTYLSDLNEIAVAWDPLWEVIRPAVERHPQEMTKESLLVALLARKMDLWAVQDTEGKLVGLGATTTLEWVDGRCLFIRYVAGRGVKAWLSELWEPWRQMLKSHGVKYVCMSGRPGWTKVLPPDWKPLALMMQREI